MYFNWILLNILYNKVTDLLFWIITSLNCLSEESVCSVNVIFQYIYVRRLSEDTIHLISLKSNYCFPLKNIFLPLVTLSAIVFLFSPVSGLINMTELWGDGVTTLVRGCYSLRLCRYHYNYSSISCPTCLSRFSVSFNFPPPFYRPPHQQPFVVLSLLSL